MLFWARLRTRTKGIRIRRFLPVAHLAAQRLHRIGSGDKPATRKGYSMRRILVMALVAIVGTVLHAEDIRIVVPYLGAAANVYEDEANSIDESDSALMEGLYLQWINPDIFQVNAFIYHSADINYSQLWGGHLIGDFYVWSNPLGKAAVGAGIEVISLNMDAGDSIAPLQNFELPTTLYVPYARAGHYFFFGSPETVQLSVFPWAGAEYDISRGDLSFLIDVNGPAPGGLVPVEESTDDETLYGIAGLSVSTTIMHFVDLQAKYKATFNADDFLSTIDAMANVYFTRHWGVSYRFKYMQSTSGSTSYHIVGIAYLF